MTNKGAYTLIDLFAGAGGMSEGFRQHGFRTLYANDHELPALEIYEQNHDGVRISSDDIETIDARRIREDLDMVPGRLDVLIGGPPCQGFSTYGQRNPADHRNALYQHYIRFLREFRPKAFVIENVVGILSMQNGMIIDDIMSQIRDLGYTALISVLDAADFGVPQFRKRVFIIGAESGARLSTPIATHGVISELSINSKAELELFPADKAKPNLLPYVTVRDAISDLPAEALRPKDTHLEMPYHQHADLTRYQKLMRKSSSCLSHHSAKQMLGIRRLRMALLRPGDYGTKIKERLLNEGLPDQLIEELLADKSSLRDINECRMEDRIKEISLRDFLRKGHVDIDTVLETLDSGGFANKYRRLAWELPSHTIVAHMARDCSDFVHPEIDRFVSVREAARLQSFPDYYRFPGSQFRQFRAIGNAVPPILGAVIATQLIKALTGQDSTNKYSVDKEIEPEALTL